jgi:hypothetical protein
LSANAASATVPPVRVYAIRDLTSSGSHPLGGFIDVFLRRDDAERLVDNVRRDDRALADALQIVEVELAAGDELVR